MPIDISVENPIPLIQAAAHVPRRRRGRKAAASTLHRWATHGLRGIVLETLQVGGTKCTSLAALQRFFDRLSDSKESSCESSNPPRRRGFEQADRDLDASWSRTGNRPACLKPEKPQT